MLHITPLAPDCKPANHALPEVGVDAALLANLDPVRYRIILEHWFGIRAAGVGVDTVATAA